MKQFYNKRLGLPLVSIIWILNCLILWLGTLISHDIYQVFATRTSPIYWWQYFSGTFQHSIFPQWFLTLHFAGNMLIVLVFGIMIEKVLGSKSYFILSLISGSLVAVFFQLDPVKGTYAGFSGIAWSYAPVVVYIIFLVYKEKGRKIFKGGLLIGQLFLLFCMCGPMNIDAYIPSHILAVLTGVIATMIWRKDIKKRVEEILADTPVDVRCGYKRNESLLTGLSVLPLGILIIMLTYFEGGLNKIFVNIESISDYSSLQVINENEQSIVVTFDDVFTENGVTQAQWNGYFMVDNEITHQYSEDRTQLIIQFKNKLQQGDYIEVNLIEGEFESGRTLREFKLILE